MTPPQPLYFGPDGRPLFGWLHRPAVAGPHGAGLVICNPFGYEAICAHRSIRHFAQHAAASGIPALRFDYDGSGDSTGHDLEPERLGAWIASIRHAADTLRGLTGVPRVAFLGIRLGATLAALATEDRADVAALIAIAPAVDAKMYIRELRMLQLAMDSKRGLARARDDGALETCGFVLTAETQKSLTGIDLSRREAAPPPRVLILERAGLPSGESWARQLGSRGARVERLEVDGYAEMMLDSHESRVPRAMMQTAFDWLGTPGPYAAASTAPTTRKRVKAQFAGIEESPVQFGKWASVSGIVSAPASDAGRKAILLLNSGAVHHVGPSRLYVDLARRWAKLGHVVLRMDIAGIGDSAPRPGEAENIVYPRYAVQDIGEAIEYLKREWGATEFRALGVCSGAYHAFKAAVAGLPLAGIVLINPLTFYWREGMSLKYPEHRIAADIIRYRTNVWRPASWVKLLSGRVDLWELSQVLGRRAFGLALEPLRALAHVLRIPMHQDLGADLNRIADRGVDLHFVFAAQEPGIELLRNQGGYALRRLRARSQLNVRVIAGADHTFTDRVHRETLAALLAEKLDNPASALPPPCPAPN